MHDDAVLSLMARPNVADIADLRGRGPIPADAPTTGYAFALRGMLAMAGLTEAHASFFRVGGHADCGLRHCWRAVPQRRC
jgi:hypothetical protein